MSNSSGLLKCIRRLSSVPRNFKHVEEIRIPVPWGHISGKWWGPRDVKPILALHGWLDNANTWDKIVPFLPSDLSILCIDLAGHGHSSHYPPGMPYYQINFVTDVRRVIKHYGWDNVLLLGHSLGSMVSFMYSAIYPDEVKAYIGVEAFPPSPHNQTISLNIWANSINGLVDSFSQTTNDIPSYTYNDAIRKMCQASKNSLTKESAEVLFERGASKQNDGTYKYLRDPRLKNIVMLNWPGSLIEKMASSIKTNVLLISGCSGRRYDEPHHYFKSLISASKSVRKLKYHVVEGTHHIHLNNPETVAPIINDFLKDLLK